MLQHLPGKKSELEQQFEKVTATSAGVQRLVCSEAQSSININKNRDPNILPRELPTTRS